MGYCWRRQRIRSCICMAAFRVVLVGCLPCGRSMFAQLPIWAATVSDHCTVEMPRRRPVTTLFFFSLRMLLAEVWGRWEDGVTQSRRRRRSSGDCFSEMGARISAAANILVTKQPLAKVGAMGKRQVQPIKPSESHEHANRCSTSPLVKPGKRNNPTRRRTKRIKNDQPWAGFTLAKFGSPAIELALGALLLVIALEQDRPC